MEFHSKTHTSVLVPNTGLAHSRSLINTDLMNTEVERRDLEAHRVISRNSNTCYSKTCRTYACPAPSLRFFFPSSHPFLPPSPWYCFFFLICCHALLYGIDQDFKGASFGRGRMFVVGKRKKIEEQLLFDIRGTQKFSYSSAFLSLHSA